MLPFMARFREMVKVDGYLPKHVFNVDKTGVPSNIHSHTPGHWWIQYIRLNIELTRLTTESVHS
jgi:hypothetical protein